MTQSNSDCLYRSKLSIWTQPWPNHTLMVTKVAPKTGKWKIWKQYCEWVCTAISIPNICPFTKILKKKSSGCSHCQDPAVRSISVQVLQPNDLTEFTTMNPKHPEEIPSSSLSPNSAPTRFGQTHQTCAGPQQLALQLRFHKKVWWLCSVALMPSFLRSVLPFDILPADDEVFAPPSAVFLQPCTIEG